MSIQILVINTIFAFLIGLYNMYTSCKTNTISMYIKCFGFFSFIGAIYSFENFSDILFTFLISLIFFVWYSVKRRLDLFEFVVLMLIANFSVLIAADQTDMYSVYFAIELQNLILFILIVIKRINFINSIEAALKYFFISAVGAGLYFFGTGFVYMYFGTLNLREIELFSIYNSFFPANFLYFGLACIFSSLFIKISAFPFHFWTPDVYSGASFGSLIYIACVSKLLVFNIVFDFLHIFDTHIFYSIVFYIGLVSLFFGVISSYYQTNVRRFIAYSSISHVGLILIGISLFEFNNDLLEVGFMYLDAYIFWLAIFLISLRGAFFVDKNIIYEPLRLGDMVGLGYTKLPVAILFGLSLLAISGIPPFDIFFAKFDIFMLLAYSVNIYTLLFILPLFVLSFFYYLRIIKVIYFEYPTYRLYSYLVKYKN